MLGAKSDITGSIPHPSANSPTARPAAAPAQPNHQYGDRLPTAIGGPKLRSAAIAGDAGAAYEVAVRFAEGRGVPVNLDEAARWYERAANKGVTLAQFRYASMLEKGLGVKKDLAAARRFYMAAAAKGNSKAMHNLAVLYAEGIEGKPDYATAVQWFRKAAQRGIADSQYNLGVLCARGLGTAKSYAEAYKWFALGGRPRRPGIRQEARRARFAHGRSSACRRAANGRALRGRAAAGRRRHRPRAARRLGSRRRHRAARRRDPCRPAAWQASAGRPALARLLPGGKSVNNRARPRKSVIARPFIAKIAKTSGQSRTRSRTTWR